MFEGCEKLPAAIFSGRSDKVPVDGDMGKGRPIVQPVLREHGL